MQGYFVVPTRNIGLLNGYVKKNGVVLARADNRVLRDAICGPANRLTYRYYSGLYRNCDAIHYPTQFLRDLYEGMYGPTNGYVISNGINTRFHPIPAEKPAGFRDKYVIVFTGRYSGEKSHAVLIDAVNCSAHREQIQLIFAGEGPRKEQLVKRARKLPIQPVFSFFSRDQMVQILNFADLHVHPA